MTTHLTVAELKLFQRSFRALGATLDWNERQVHLAYDGVHEWFYRDDGTLEALLGDWEIWICEQRAKEATSRAGLAADNRESD